MLMFHNIATKIVICSWSRNGGIPFLFFCQIEEVLQSSQDFDKFFVQFDVENTGVSWKVDQTILFVFCQIDELLLAALLARNQSFSTFPI